MRQINLTNTHQHYNMCQKKVLIGYATHQFNKYTAKLQSVAHKSMYLETDQLNCFARHSRKSSSLTRVFFYYRTLSVIETCDGNLVSTLLSIAAPQAICNDVSYDIVSFLIPNPQHTVSLYTFIYQESAWSGRSGLSLRKHPETIELI